MTSKSDSGIPLEETQDLVEETHGPQYLPVVQHSTMNQPQEPSTRVATLTTIVFLCVALFTVFVFRESIFTVDKGHRILYVPVHAFPQDPSQGISEQQATVEAISSSVVDPIVFSPVYALPTALRLSDGAQVSVIGVDPSMAHAVGLEKLDHNRLYTINGSAMDVEIIVPVPGDSRSTESSEGRISVAQSPTLDPDHVEEFDVDRGTSIGLVSTDTFERIAQLALGSTEHDVEKLAHSSEGEEAHLTRALLYSFSDPADLRRAQKALEDLRLDSDVW